MTPTLREQSTFPYWFAKIQQLPDYAAIPYPATIVLKLDANIKKALWAALDGENPPSNLDLSKIHAALNVLKYPAFIRTEHGSGKHEFDRCCYIEKPEDLFNHLVALNEWSQLAQIMGLSFDYLIVREYLPPVHSFKAFLGLPIAKEYRVFVKDGKVVCKHFYWPEEAIEVFGDYILPGDWKEQLKSLDSLTPEEDHLLITLAERFGSVLPGNWSVDFMKSESGWVMIDAARAEHSWHPDDCPRQLFWRDE